MSFCVTLVDLTEMAITVLAESQQLTLNLHMYDTLEQCMYYILNGILSYTYTKNFCVTL